MGFLARLFGKQEQPAAVETETGGALVSLDELAAFEAMGSAAGSIFDGSKFAGGFGVTQVQHADYWTLRARSSQLFNENLYARGLIRRLVTNEINVGLHLEAVPDESILGFEEDALNDWSELVENRFEIWEQSPQLCDYRERDTFGTIQESARAEALVAGDVLAVLRQSSATKLPNVQLVGGSSVQTPIGGAKVAKGHEIVHGVELDPRGRHAAFWILQADGTYKRLPAYGASGRRIAWLVYGTDKRLDDVRGQPLLSLVLQSLKEIDRYRDSVQRKAVVNSILALFIKKTEDKPGTMPITGGAVRKGSTVATDPATGKPRAFKIAQQIPGLALEELQQGEEPVAFQSHTDMAFGPFEDAIINAVAWANEIPPEIMRLAFSHNYSASQAAINEFKAYLNKARTRFGAQFCQPIYVDWLLSEALLGKIDAPGLLRAWRDPEQYDIYGAWTRGEWSGAIKPSTDIHKQARGYEILADRQWITNDRAARELTGMKFTKIAKRQRRENELRVEAARPLAEFRREYGEKEADKAIADAEAMAERVAELVVNNE